MQLLPRQTDALLVRTASIVGGAPAPAPEAERSKQAAATSPAVSVTLSPEAQVALVSGAGQETTKAESGGSVASRAVAGLLASDGSSIYSAAISGLKTYPADLSTRADEIALKKAPTDAEKVESLKLNRDRNDRENQAFFHFAKEANAAATPAERNRLMAQYYKAYTEFYDGLSPSEQASSRYAGTREAAVSSYDSWSQQAAQPPENLSGSQDPVLMLFGKIKAKSFNTDASGEKSLLDSYKDSASSTQAATDISQTIGNLAADASARFTAVQSVVNQEKSGDPTAFVQLKTLASSPTSIASFLDYAESLAKYA